MRSVWVAACVMLASCTPTRECGEGTVLEGRTCVPEVVDFCAAQPCANLAGSICEQDAQGAHCRCPDSLVEVQGQCVPPSACAPNPCTGLRRTTCLVVAGAASCECDDGFLLEADGCSEFSEWDCAQQHDDGDAAEPDECPALAPTGALGQHFLRTLSAGDRDWLKLTVPPGHIIEVSALGATTPVMLEVYQPAPLRRLGFASGTTATVRAATAQPELWVRVQAVSPSAGGSYELLAVDRGVDDFGNDALGAGTIETTTSGELQYPADVDVFRLHLRAGQATGIQLRGPMLTLRLSRGARTLTVSAGETVTVAFPEDTDLLATIRGPGDFTAYTLQLTELGPDDGCDEAAFASPLVVGQGMSGRFERTQDGDSFSIAQEPGHLYRPDFTGATAVRISDSVNRILAIRGSGSQDSLVWQGPADGSNVVLTMASQFAPGTWSLVVTDLGFDDHADGIVGATPLALGDFASGNLERADDVDTFELEVQQGHGYSTGVQAAQRQPVTLILDSFGIPVATSGANAVTGFLARRSGKQWVQVRSARVFDSYTLRVVDVGVDDHADTALGATPLSVGTPVAGVLVETDVDAFTFTAQPREVYRLRVLAQSPGDFQLTVRDASGGALEMGSGLELIVAPATGPLTVLVRDFQQSVATYSLELTVAAVDEHGDDATSATAISIGQSVPVEADFEGDVDALNVMVTANHGYAISVSGGRVQTQLGGAMALSSFLATSSGLATVLWNNPFGPPGPATLRVDDLGVDDHADTFGAATAFTGSTANGVIQFPQDRDVFRAPTMAGHFYRCLVATPATCTVFNALGSQFGTDFAGDGSDVFLQLASATTGAYSVQLLDTGVDDHGNTRAQATVLIDGAPTTGVAQLGNDTDAFLINTTAGQIINVELVNQQPLFTTLRDAADVQLFTTNSGSGSVDGFRSLGGPHLLEVRASSVVPYTVTARVVTDDYDEALPSALTSGVLRTGKLEFPEDRDVFSFFAGAGTQVSLSISANGPMFYVVRGPGGAMLPSSFVVTTSGTHVLEISATSSRVATYSILLAGP